MEIHSGGRRVEMRGDRVFVDGKEVAPGEGTSSSKVESEASSQARTVLETKYPGVIFQGDCSKITVGSEVVLEPGVTIQQNDNAKIEILGKSVLKELAFVSTPESTNISLSSVSFSGRSSTVTSIGGGISVSSSQISVGNSDDTGLVKIEDSTIGRHSEVSGLSIELSRTIMSDRCKVLCPGSGEIKIIESKLVADVSCAGSGEIEINKSEIGANVSCAGSGEICIEESKNYAVIQCTGSGEIDIKNSSDVKGTISAVGSGNITVDGAKIEHSASLSVTGSGDIKVKNTVVSTPQSVTGSKSIRL